MEKDNLACVNELASEIGSFIEYWGFKSIHGKVWTHLFLSPTPLDASELMRRLRISKSLASITINDLLQNEVIFLKGKGPNDTQVYCANENIRDVILKVLRAREMRMMTRMQETFARIEYEQSTGADPRFSSERISSLGQMISQASSTLNSILDLRSVDFDKINLKF